MKTTTIIIAAGLILNSCTSSKKLSYLNNLHETKGEEYFAMDVPDYKIQPRDILYITIKAMTPDGMITDFLAGNRANAGAFYMQNESGQYLFGYDVDTEGNISLPVIGKLKMATNTLEQAKKILQEEVDKKFNNATVECKLLSFKFTVIGEVKTPGTYLNYNNYLTVFEAIGRAGGIGDFGKRNKVLVIRAAEKGTNTYSVDLQDKNILSSKAYFLMPNDVVIVEPQSNKIFNMNLPIISFLLTSITSTVSMLILILSFTKGN